MLKYVNLEKIPNPLTPSHLKISLTPEGREYALHYQVTKSSENLLTELLEYQLCNGWTEILPEEIGALTCAQIFTDDCSKNDDNELTQCGTVFAFMDYQVTDPIEALLTKGYILLEAATSLIYLV